MGKPKGEKKNITTFSQLKKMLVLSLCFFPDTHERCDAANHPQDRPRLRIAQKNKSKLLVALVSAFGRLLHIGASSTFDIEVSGTSSF